MSQKTSSMLLYEFYPLIDCPWRGPFFHVQLPYQIKSGDTWQQPYFEMGKNIIEV